MEKKRTSFKGSIGFVLAAAGSAVGLGNIWRFPYLAAKDGGGLFLVIYIILALTFGFALLTTEVAIGRHTKGSPLVAYGQLKKSWKHLGILAALIPMMILPYYVTIGGWVIRYAVAYLTGNSASAATDGDFTGFITSDYSPIVYMVIFLLVVAVIVYLGVEKGIEISSRILMPILVLLVIGIAIFALTISYTDDSGVTRTGLDGFAAYVIPDLEGMTVQHFFTVVMDAMGQLFYSLSVAMGIMIAYGSYVPDEANLGKSINQIELFDTLIAFLAGVMIIPAVFCYAGREGMSASGPSLMFVLLPKVFSSMGFIGGFVGCLFFVMVFFAALTSAVSIMEAIVSSLMDEFGFTRKKAVIVEALISLVVGTIVCMGYNRLYFEVTLPNGTVAQILDVLDYISNYIMMPIVSIGTCILIGWIMKPELVINEVQRNGENMGRKKLYIVMVKFIAPAMLILLFLKSLGVLTVI